VHENIPEQEEKDTAGERRETACNRTSALRTRPSGSPRKMVNPATAPRARVCAVDTRFVVFSSSV
jgi:hypothetical protein